MLSQNGAEDCRGHGVAGCHIQDHCMRDAGYHKNVCYQLIPLQSAGVYENDIVQYQIAQGIGHGKGNCRHLVHIGVLLIYIYIYIYIYNYSVLMCVYNI